ncbi:tRNA isopentenyltransferase [Nannizzia gypsea CBS 118893]|uniref:tRNA dimethylallyltransferase n=1 Tax=Arthroderma gypseum (strain ATCC MYA-4604 / CBS 118893) TaxID=535722 RepID=E4UYV3_ARTGP|nr:tRNA isopentenyltransferase [Nannizzia gypsea CBS 118893]EFR03283.1 tRNA isopentenyltransferase [Nannizzia gypsea CBS 118893]
MFRASLSLRTTANSHMNPLIAVVGATGTGKSKLAVDLALRVNGEIISADAMQMYKGLPITTNQIPIEERHGIPHHLIGCVDLDQDPWRIGVFKKESLKIIDEIRSRGKVPILVGGTHYYTQSVLFHEPLLDEGKPNKQMSNQSEDLPSDEDLTADSKKDVDFSILNASAEEVYEKLKEVDPVMANRWHPNEKRKVRRSLEIYLQTGRRASDIYEEQKKKIRRATPQDEDYCGADESEDLSTQLGQARFSLLVFWVHTEKEELRKRLDKRVHGMIDQGLLKEAQKMFKYLQDKASEGVEVDRTRGVWMSIGFKELEPYINELLTAKEEPKCELDKMKEECIESIQAATKVYAKHQTRWIRNKLWKALGTSGMTDRLYIADSTDVDNWDTIVRQPAEEITSKFLSGSTLPHPKEMSAVAKEFFESANAPARFEVDDIPQMRVCSTCNATIAGADTWELHMKGRRHKRAIKSAENRRRRDEYFQKLQEKSNEDNGAPSTEL